MHVIAKKSFSHFKQGEKYKIVNADMYEYQVEYQKGLWTWIGKDDIEHFDYHV